MSSSFIKYQQNMRDSLVEKVAKAKAIRWMKTAVSIA
jgi:hypothetical protein